jgi:hypothetical protein
LSQAKLAGLLLSSVRHSIRYQSPQHLLANSRACSLRISRPANPQFYVLENQNEQFCDVDAGNNQTVDSRFTYLGLQTNEFDV